MTCKLVATLRGCGSAGGGVRIGDEGVAGTQQNGPCADGSRHAREDRGDAPLAGSGRCPRQATVAKPRFCPFAQLHKNVPALFYNCTTGRSSRNIDLPRMLRALPDRHPARSGIERHGPDSSPLLFLPCIVTARPPLRFGYVHQEADSASACSSTAASPAPGCLTLPAFSWPFS